MSEQPSANRSVRGRGLLENECVRCSAPPPHGPHCSDRTRPGPALYPARCDALTERPPALAGGHGGRQGHTAGEGEPVPDRPVRGAAGLGDWDVGLGGLGAELRFLLWLHDLKEPD